MCKNLTAFFFQIHHLFSRKPLKIRDTPLISAILEISKKLRIIEGVRNLTTRTELKNEAKEILAGRWAQAILLNLIPTIIIIISLLVILIPVIALAITFDWSTTADQVQHAVNDNAGGGAGSHGGSIVGSIVGALFSSGINWTYLDLLRGQKNSINPIPNALRAFSGKYFLGILLITVVTSIFLSLWALLLLIPMFVKYYAYSQVTYVFYDIVESTGERPKTLDCITYSRKLMNGHKMDLFLLDLSFIGWHILSVMTVGIGYLWLSPYISATKAAFYNHLPNEVALA